MSKKLTHEEFVAKVNERYPNEYEFLSEYDGMSNTIHTKDLLCGLDWWANANSIYSDHIRHPEYSKELMSQKLAIPQEEFEQIFASIAGSDYELLEPYKNLKQNIKIKHKCGHVFTRCVRTILHGGGCYCPKCFPEHCKGVIVGVNDLQTKDPYIASLLKDPNDGQKYWQFSHAKTWFICPICGAELYKEIANVSSDGLSCPFCSKNISFAEKFMTYFFRYYHQENEYQFSPDWIGLRRYDFKFTKDGVDYILEVDGSWHEIDNNLSGKTAEQQKEIDRVKEEEAIKHGYVVIRLDYKYSNSTHNKEEYLKNSILHSELVDLFNITPQIVDEIMILAKSKEYIPERVYQIAEVWNKLEYKNLRNLRNAYPFHDEGLKKYLYKAFDIGLIKEDAEEIRRLNRKSQFTNGNDTRAHYAICDQTGEILNYSEAREKYRANLFRYFQNENYKNTGKLPDGTKLTWKKYDERIIR